MSIKRKSPTIITVKDIQWSELKGSELTIVGLSPGKRELRVKLTIDNMYALGDLARKLRAMFTAQKKSTMGTIEYADSCFKDAQ